MLRDLRALEHMLAENMFETGITRIGAEQEMFLVDGSWQPAPDAVAVLAAIADGHFTTEVGAFNLELNLDPQVFTGDCLRRMEAQLDQLLTVARACAGSVGLGVVLAGILPTIRKGDLSIENMVQNPRYLALNTALMSLRGEAYELHIKGTDELRVRQESVMAEACNASFQVHLQVTPDSFVNLYNIAQLLAGPVLACATNSPVLFGKRLWAETRIALFEQSVDTRRPGHHLRERSARVTFGTDWVSSSVVELYQEDITRFRPVLAPDDHVDPFDELAAGRVPTLDALRLHTGTVWRWNRGCYGITDGVPHLRIENRVLPSGPSVVDEVANAAFWLGLMRSLGDDATRRSAASCRSRVCADELRRRRPPGTGRQAHVARRHRGGRPTPSPSTSCCRSPLTGLEAVGVDSADRERYLGVVERRVRSGHTGSRWVLTSLNAMRNQGTAGQRLNSLTAAMVARQRAGTPVAEWAAANLDEGGQWRHNFVSIEQLMTTDLVTVAEDDPVELAANLMDWHRIRQVLVEDDGHSLIGLVSYRAILRLLARGSALGSVVVGDVMKRDPVCVPPDMAPLQALQLMRSFGIGALPVVVDQHLVGIVTEHDFMNVAGLLLLEQLDGVERTDS